MSQDAANFHNDGFNHDFTDEDAQRLICIASSPENKPHTCRWVQGGVRCDTSVLGRDFGTHLRTNHDIYRLRQDTPCFLCKWEGCTDGSPMTGDGMMMHIQEKHILWRWHCPNCGLSFMHKKSRDTHYAFCLGAINNFGA